MRNKFYRFAAIWVALNMMSFTVFAAEDASSIAEPTGESNLLSTGSQEETSGGEESTPAPENVADTNVNNESGNPEPAKEGNTSGEATTNNEGETNPQGSQEPAKEEGSKEGESANPEGTEPAKEENDPSKDEAEKSEESKDPSKEAPTDEDIEKMIEDTTRRTAENQKSSESSESENSSSEDNSASSEQQSSWSNDPEIQDVMGIRANVDGSNVVISYKTKHTDPYDYSYQNNPIVINYAGGNGTNHNNIISFDWDGYGIHGDNWADIDGVTISKSSDQNDTEIVSISIPASWFESMDFTVSGGNYTAGLVGTPYVEEENTNDAVYEGISLDGTFNDWDAVQKSTLVEPNDEHCVESCAWVIDKDYVYIYIKDDGSNSATWAGPNHNGKYAITTDLGRTLVFQLTEDGAVVGADGATSNHTGSQWEIAIPTSSLPQNNGGLSFGLYLSDATLTGYGDVAQAQSSTDISYDGHYGDWDNYPHKVIQYATAGTQENVPDGEAAIYVDNNIYGHCETRMQAHLNETGGEFTQAVSVLANDDWSHALMMRLATVDEAGNINWNPQRENLTNGSYEYCIFATDCWGSSENLNALNGGDICYGKATVTIQDGRHDMEWYVDIQKLADRYGIAATDLKTVSSQYRRIGPELVTSAGASSGPVGGAALCILSAFAPFVIKRVFRF